MQVESSTTRQPRPAGDRQAARWLVVAGEGRSGSTLLGSLLAGAVGGFDCGELNHLWGSWERGRLCTCGAKVADCELWSAVAHHVWDEMGFTSVQDTLRASRQWTRQRDLLRPRLPKPTDDELALRRATERAVEVVTGATTIIDSSKMPPVLWAAAHLERPLTAVLLVRDPRAVAYSWANPTPDPSRQGKLMRHKTIWQSALSWNISNLTAVRAMRHMPHAHCLEVRYEDLATRPEAEIGRILNPDGEDAIAGGESLTVTTAPAGVSHVIAGNPRRFSPSEVKLDSRWQRSMPTLARLRSTMLTAPLLPRFGYKLRSGRSTP